MKKSHLQHSLFSKCNDWREHFQYDGGRQKGQSRFVMPLLNRSTVKTDAEQEIG